MRKSYYPLYPPSEEVNFDHKNFIEYGFMPSTPDILIVPSDLHYFVKVMLNWKSILCNIKIPFKIT